MEDVGRAAASAGNCAGRRVDRPPLLSGLSWPGVRYFSTTRVGGVSDGAYASLNLGMHTGDDPARVRENRSRLRGFLPADPLWLDQVHGADVLDADRHEDRGGTPKADAAVTTRPGCVLAIMTADCLPVVLADVDGTVLGVAHAGWRGLAGSVLENTVRRLRALRPRASGFRAWIGPGISQRCFEVGDDVYTAFIDHDARARRYFVRSTRADGKWLADLASLARDRLTRAGVEDVELSGYCTYGQPERFYSYRRARDTGRGATLAWLLPPRAGTGAYSDLP